MSDPTTPGAGGEWTPAPAPQGPPPAEWGAPAQSGGLGPPPQSTSWGPPPATWQQQPTGQGPYPQPPYPQGPYPQGPYPGPPYGYVPYPGWDPYFSDKSKLAAGLLGIFLGGLGVHKFYLGNTGAGVAYILVFFFGLILLAIPSLIISIVGFIEGIILLASNNARDAHGRLLRS